jgi:hypothetical protein
MVIFLFAPTMLVCSVTLLLFLLLAVVVAVVVIFCTLIEAVPQSEAGVQQECKCG